MAPPGVDERLQAEIELLEAMYPDQLHYHEGRREVVYSTEQSNLQLRLADDYLLIGLPEVLSATAGKTDVRAEVKQRISNVEEGEEVLDTIISFFDDLAKSTSGNNVTTLSASSRNSLNGEAAPEAKATVIIWLHHLLNTNKRKQALSPPAASVSGVTKPGYPGVLVYPGPAWAVHEHVNELKQLNWAAFQIRLESEEEWLFAHGAGVVEVEAMRDVIVEVGEARKVEFMEAMRMK